MTNKTKMMGIFAVVFSLGAIATISILDNNAYAGGSFIHPDPVDTQLHGATMSFHSNDNNNFLSVNVVPFPNEPTKLWLEYFLDGGFENSGEGCMIDKSSVRGNQLHFDTSESDCMIQHGGPLVLEAQLSPNGFSSNSFSGDREFCFTMMDDNGLVLWCTKVTGHSESQSMGGSATVFTDGVELPFDLDAEINGYVETRANAGKCNVKLYGDPVEYLYQVLSACSSGVGLN